MPEVMLLLNPLLSFVSNANGSNDSHLCNDPERALAAHK